MAHARLPQLFDDLVRVETRLYNALNGRLLRTCGVSCSQYEFLAYLDEHPAGRVGEVAEYFAVGVGATSKGVDRLVAAGWVARRANPADGRSSLLGLTADGARLVERARAAADDLLGRLLGDASESDLRTVSAVLGGWRRSLEQGAVGTPAG